MMLDDSMPSVAEEREKLEKEPPTSATVLMEAIRLWASFMELNKHQSTKIQYLIMMIRVLLTVVIVELGVLIGLILSLVLIK